jgi:hypothetical protein
MARLPKPSGERFAVRDLNKFKSVGNQAQFGTGIFARAVSSAGHENDLKQALKASKKALIGSKR